MVEKFFFAKVRDVPDIRLNRISDQDLGIRFNRISGTKRYPVLSGRIAYPVLSSTLLNGKESKLTLIKSRSRYDFKHAYDVHTCILQRDLKVKVKLI